MGTRVYRAAASAYGIFAAITGALAVLWLAAVWRAGAPWLPVLVPLAGYGLVALWLSCFRVVLGEEEVLLAVPFRRTRRFLRSEVLSVEFADETGRSESPMTLSIRLSLGEELRLNAKIFSAEAIECLLALGASQSNKPRSAR